MASRHTSNGLSTVPVSGERVVIVGGVQSSEMVIAKAFVSHWGPDQQSSQTLTVKSYGPSLPDGGVPLISPCAFRAKFAGGEPDQVSDVTPPVARSVIL